MIKADAGLDCHGWRLPARIHRQDAVHFGEIERSTAGILRRVAITATQAAWHDTSSCVGCAQGRYRVSNRVDLRQMRHGSRSPAPAVQLHKGLRNHGLLLRHGGLDRRYRLVAHSQVRSFHQKKTAMEITASQTRPSPCSTRSLSTTSSGSPAVPASTSSAYCSSASVKGAIEIAVQGTPSGLSPRFSNAQRLYEMSTITAANIHAKRR